MLSAPHHHQCPDPMVGTLVNSMVRLEDGIIHALTDDQIIEMASANPPEGACTLFPWLLNRPTELLDLVPSVQTYASALQIMKDGMDIFRMGAPQRHVMAVRSDQGCFAVLWDLSVPHLHHLGEVEAAVALTAPAPAPTAAAAPTMAPVVAAAVSTSATAPMAQTSVEASLLARIQSLQRSASSS